MKLGKLSPQIPAGTSHYKDKVIAPIYPPSFDGTHGVTYYRMWDNDRIGDCTVAAAFNREWIMGQQEYDDTDAVETYSAITGYSPANPATDQGAVCSDVLAHWKTVGFPISAISKHPKCYISEFHYISPQEVDLIKHAIATNGCAYVGIQFPSTAYQQFAEGCWYVAPNAQIEGGHCVLLAGYTENAFLTITWGKTILMTVDFWLHYGDEAWAVA